MVARTVRGATSADVVEEFVSKSSIRTRNNSSSKRYVTASVKLDYRRVT